MKMFQVTLEGWTGDGENDDRIVWCVADDIDKVRALLDQMDVPYIDLEETDLDPDVIGVDFKVYPDEQREKTISALCQLEKDMHAFITAVTILDEGRFDLDEYPVLLRAQQLLQKYQLFKEIGFMANVAEAEWEALATQVEEEYL